ncbi:hypothetical protein [Gordonia sihwensis]|uniref:hypothetical protein n=1 Tax=Gordonia TaxID=2053 RepID=UPI002417CA42|nr:hypothetical protein [Gordonia sihwensis]WFN93944.1 hypothetical protein P5P27_05150 [Gordonia sihwensis]
MKLSLVKRGAIVAAAAAVAGAGLTAAPAVTGAVGGASAATCKSESTEKRSLVVDYSFQKSVPATVAQGGTVTYSLAVSTSSVGNPYVQKVWDVPPTALRDVKPVVKVKAFTLLGGILGGGGAFGPLINESTINPANVQKDGISWSIAHTGWAVFSGQAFVAEFSYQLPSSIRAGKQLTSGGATFNATPNPPLGHVDMPGLTACTTVRAPNAGEAITGSLDSAGLGSSEGQLSSTGSLTDMIPAIIGGAVGGQDD